MRKAEIKNLRHYFFVIFSGNLRFLDGMGTWDPPWVAYECHRRPWYKILRANIFFWNWFPSIKKTQHAITSPNWFRSFIHFLHDSKVIAPPPGKKRRVRERVYGVTMKSLPNGKWHVQWAGGSVEDVSPRNLKLEGPPTPETMDMVRVFNITGGGGNEELLGPAHSISLIRREANASISEPSQVTVILPHCLCWRRLPT